jgi:hypothetical protein
MPKGAKEPRGFSVSHQKGESKPMLKGAKEPRGFSINHLQRGIRTLCQSQLNCLENLSNKKKQNFTISRESLLSTWIKLV